MDAFKSILPTSIVDNPAISFTTLAFFCSAVYVVGLLIYRLVFSPFPKFPGSRIAAATHYYEFYYDSWCQCQYIYEIEKMHQRHAPTGSHFLTTDHDLHGRRRRPLKLFFSRLGILRLQNLLADTTEKLADRFEQAKEGGAVIRLDHAFFALSGDVVGKLCWAEKEEFLGDPSFTLEWCCPLDGIVRKTLAETARRFNLVHASSNQYIYFKGSLGL